MTNYSVSTTTPFSQIDWNNFENRPSISGQVPFCTPEQEDDPMADCCVDWYGLEAITDQMPNSPVRDFLLQGPCLNGEELIDLAESSEPSRPEKKPTTKKPTTPKAPSEPECDKTMLKSLGDLLQLMPFKTDGLRKLLPELCQATMEVITSIKKQK